MRFPEERPEHYAGELRFQAIIEPDPSEAILNTITNSMTQAVRNDQLQEQADVLEATDPAAARILRMQSQASGFDKSKFQGQDAESQPVVKEILEGNGPDVVTLYLPQGLNIRDGASYENVDLGILGGAVEQGIKSGSNMVQAGMNALADEGKSFIDSFKTGIGSNAANIAALRASKYFGDTAQSAVRSATRTTINPNTKALFRSIPLREFSFTWKMIPDSKKESENIKRIIKWFRTELYPEEINGGDFSIAYKFPNKIAIGAYHNGTPVATKILPSFIQSVSVTYNGSNMSFHEEGDFTEVDLTVNFLESRPLKKKEVIGSGY